MLAASTDKKIPTTTAADFIPLPRKCGRSPRGATLSHGKHEH